MSTIERLDTIAARSGAEDRYRLAPRLGPCVILCMLRSTLHCTIVLPGEDATDVRQAISMLPARSFHLSASRGMLTALLDSGNALFPGLRWYLIADERGPVALVPLQWVRESDSKLKPVALYSLSRFELLYGDALVRDDVAPGSVIDAVLNTVRAGEPRPDVLRLRDLPTDSALLAMARERTGTGDMIAKPGTSLLSGGDNAATWEASLSKNLRGHVRQAAKRLAARGPVEIRTAVALPDIQAAFARFLVLEASGYKGTLNSLAHEHGDRQVLEQALYHHAATGESLVMELWVAGALAASQFGICRGNRLFLIKVAYNEELADASPGAFLMAELMRWVSDHPELAEVDCCVRQKWHDRWHPDLEDRTVATVANRSSWRGAVLGAMRWVRARR